MDLTADQRVAVIDVPGHERFVRQMIAGAAGIDLVMLVIAADEGVMPQTREHLDICGLLGVRAGLVVITKTDLVDEEWLELVKDDIAMSLEGSFLEGAPMVEFSAGDEAAAVRVKQGVAAVLSAQDESGGGSLSRANRPFKMSVDRVFSVRGFGTVVTGTSATGTVKVGDSVSLLPGERVARIRGLQVHGTSVESAGPGMRLALNLQGLDHDEVQRGEVITHADGLDVVSMFDGTFRAISRLDNPLPTRSRVLVHLGTAQVEATLAWLDRDELEPGQQCPAQVRLERPIPILPGEPFVVRGFNVLSDYGKTVGGGQALTGAKRRHRRRDKNRLDLVESLCTGSVEDMLVALVAFEGQEGCPAEGLARRLPADKQAIENARVSALASGSLWDAGGHLYHDDVLLRLLERSQPLLAEHHQQHPAYPGLDTQALRTKLQPNLPQALFNIVLSEGIKRGLFIQAGEVLALPTFTSSLDPQQLRDCQTVHNALLAGALTPMRVQDLPEEIQLSAKAIDNAIELLVVRGDLVRVTMELVYAASVIETLVETVRHYLEEHESMDTAAFKALTGASRKWAIPLGEHLDRMKVTVRVGNDRKLRRSNG
jgi:selenocysteine-specific elongation factor